MYHDTPVVVPYHSPVIPVGGLAKTNWGEGYVWYSIHPSLLRAVHNSPFHLLVSSIEHDLIDGHILPTFSAMINTLSTEKKGDKDGNGSSVGEMDRKAPVWRSYVVFCHDHINKCVTCATGKSSLFDRLRHVVLLQTVLLRFSPC
jgi:hypothetical protein